MPLEDNRALLTRFRAGDRKAMETVFREYGDQVARYIGAGFSFGSRGRPIWFAGVKSRFDLHDVVAETFRRAFEERARLSYDGLSPYSGYIKRIARNLVIDRLRADKKLQLTDPQSEANEPLTLSTDDPSKQYDRAELGQMVGQFLGMLDARERQFVTLRFQEGLSQEEVAARMRVSRRWVRTREKRLRHQLLKELRHSGHLPSKARGQR